MRSLSLILLLAVGATIAVYTPLKELYPPRHKVFAFAVETVPELEGYVPRWLTMPPETNAVPALAAIEPDSAERFDVQPVKAPLIEAAATVLDGGSTWTGFQPDPLLQLLQDMGFPAELSTSDDGEEMILVNRKTGLDFALVLKACDDVQDTTDCKALLVAAIVFQEMDDGVIASMNRRHDAMKFAKLDGGDLQITRYVTADYGIARDNVKANIAAFVDILDLYMGTG